MGVVVPTNSALATLTVSKVDYDNDLLLQWLTQVASPLQLKVYVVDQVGATTWQLQAQNLVLSSRNAILRGLCGSVLHGALDQAPWYFLGGSTKNAAKMGQLMYWMSLADSVRNKETTITILTTLNQHLSTKSFLIGSSQPCLADYDLALALSLLNPSNDFSPFPFVQRWYLAVLWSFQSFAKPTWSHPVSVAAPTTGPLMFYYGTEDVATVLKPPKDTTAATAPDASANEESVNKHAAAGGGGGGKGGQKQQQHSKQLQKQQQQSKGEGGKQEKKKGGATAAATAAALDVDAGVTISALDIRVGKIVQVWHHQEAEKLFCEQVDLGNETRQIASGLRPFYQTQDLQDRLVLVLCNLKKRNLVGFPSHGMVLCASNADHTAVELVVPPQGSQPGDRIIFDGIPASEPEPENKVAKKKLFETLAPDLKTDADGHVVWKSHKAKTGAGFVKALNGMPHAQVA